MPSARCSRQPRCSRQLGGLKKQRRVAHFAFCPEFSHLPPSAKQILAFIMKNVARTRSWCVAHATSHCLFFPLPSPTCTERLSFIMRKKICCTSRTCCKFLLYILIKKRTEAKLQQFHITSVYPLIKIYMLCFPGLRRCF